MKFAVLGTTEIATHCAQALLDSGADVCVLITMPWQVRPNYSFDVASFALDRGIPYHEVEDINSPSSVDLIKAASPDYIFCTWSRILRKESLEIPRNFCIGTHPTDLPFNRGMHPLH